MSISYEDAKEIAIDHINRNQLPEDQQLDGNKLILLEEETIKRDYGWYFIWTASKWFETGEFKYAIAGGGPFLVRSDTGELITFMSAYSVEENFEGYEKQLDRESS